MKNQKYVYRKWQTLVERVAQAYYETLLGVRCLAHRSMQYKIEVERAVEFALKDEPERASLHAAWIRFVSSPNVIEEATAQAMVLVGQVFRSRGLHPSDYFRKLHKDGSERYSKPILRREITTAASA